MELKVYLEFLRRRWWLLVLGPVVAAIGAFLITKQMTPQYQATATLLVNRTVTPGTLNYEDVLTSESLTNTYAKLVESPVVLDAVIDNLGLLMQRHELDAKINVAAVSDTQLLEISARDPDPEMAAQLANTTATTFAENNASQLSSPGTVSVAKEAQVPLAPVSPKLMINVAFAFVLGAMAAGGIGLLLDYLDDTVKSGADVEALASVPAIGFVGLFKGSEGKLQASEFQSREAEAYRQIRTNIHFADLGAGLKTISITSANPGEGKSTTASNLAAVLAQAGDRVILVDADLRRSSLRKTFGGPTSFGLTGLLYNDVQDPALALTSTRWTNLRLLPAGVLPPNPSELLTSMRMTRLVEKLRGMADYVIFDTPPVLAVTDAIVIAAITDATIVVAEAGKTRTEALRETARTLSQAKARVLGVVLNKARVRRSAYYYYRSDEEEATEITAEPQATVTAAPAIPEHLTRAAIETPPAPEPLKADPEPVLTSLDNSGSAMETLLRRHIEGASSGLSAHSSGPVQKSVNGNGNGHGVSHEAIKQEPMNPQTPPLTAAVSDLLAQMDETVGLIRSLRPGDGGQKRQDL